MRKRGTRFLLAASTVALATGVHANETTSYKYDALGRLVEQTSTGTVNNGVNTQLCYDPAGNRSTYKVTGVGGSAPAPPACPTPPPPGSPPPPPPPGSPPPPPPPPGGNNPPTAVNNSGSQARCTTGTYNVTANDSDVDGDYPLSLVSVTGVGFSVLSSTTVQFISTSSTGAKVSTYTVQDSRGATATATLTVNVSGGSCE